MSIKNEQNKGNNYIFLVLLLILFISGSIVHSQCETVIDISLWGAARVAAGHLDGDSLIDIVASGVRADRIAGYSAPLWSQFIIGQNLDSVGYLIIADMDSDDDNDVVASVLGDDAVYWFENPAWTKHVITNNLDGASGIAVIDIDGDDTLDVVAGGTYSNTIIWYEAPAWIPHTIDSNVGSGGVEALIATDLDRNGQIDVVASVWHKPFNLRNGSIVRYEAPGWAKQTVDQSIGYCLDLEVGDLDNDDTLDVAATGFGTDVVVWYDVPGWQRKIIDANLNLADGVAIADMDGDGLQDVVAGGQQTGNPVRYYHGPDWTSTPVDASLSGNNYADLAIADFNGDDALDVVAARINLNQVVIFTCVPTAIGDDISVEVPYSFALQQNYPNPFNPETTIEFTLPQPGYTTLKIYTILGREVVTLVADKLQSGVHSYYFDGSELASGVYYYQLKSGDLRDVKKMILLQ